MKGKHDAAEENGLGGLTGLAGRLPELITREVWLGLIGVLGVFLMLAWEPLSGLLLETDQHPVEGTIAARDLYATQETKVKLPSTGRDAQILAGERLVSRGERITADQAARIVAVFGVRGQVDVAGIAGELVLTLLMAAILLMFILQIRARMQGKINYPLLLAVILGEVFASKVTVGYALDPDLMYMLNPVPIALILVAIFISTELALILNVMLSIVTSMLFLPAGALGPFKFAIYSILGGTTAIFACSPRQSERADVLKAGLSVGIANVLVLLALSLIFREHQGPMTFQELFARPWVGLVNGLSCAVLSLGLIPFLEDLFHVTTSTRLLELVNPSHPLLQKLITEAPGTFHHSMNVAHLAEKAAEEVGADPYLAKAAAYYHDLGKTRRPYYFIENQMGGVNYHDNLSPQLSRLIIMSHTKDGVEIGQKYGLPKPILDVMLEHHGTDLVAYFFHKARQTETADEQVDELTYRYTGPKPQTREAAIIMMADGVEAASRTLRKPTPQSIETLVNKIINDHFVDGQFDECDVTRKDCEVIAQCFTKILMGMYHSRITYPDDLEERALRLGKALSERRSAEKAVGAGPALDPADASDTDAPLDVAGHAAAPDHK